MKTTIIVMVVLTISIINEVHSYPTQTSRGAKRNIVYEGVDNDEGNFLIDTRQHKQLSTGSSDITAVVASAGTSAKQPTAHLPGNGFANQPLKSPFTQNTRTQPQPLQSAGNPGGSNPGSFGNPGSLGNPGSSPTGNRGTGGNQSPNRGTGNNKKKTPGKDKEEEVSSEEGSNEDDDSSQEDSNESDIRRGPPPPPSKVEPEESIEDGSNQEDEEEDEEEED